MRVSRLSLLLVLSIAACDDTEFPAHSVEVTGDGYDAVLEVVDGNCISCHTGDSAPMGLNLADDLCAEILDDRMVVPGDAEGSVLYQRITSAAAPMPQGGLMDQGNIDIIGDWINDGAECGDDTEAR